jgi:thiamine biosynthesis protein ThiC
MQQSGPFTYYIHYDPWPQRVQIFDLCLAHGNMAMPGISEHISFPRYQSVSYGNIAQRLTATEADYNS